MSTSEITTCLTGVKQIMECEGFPLTKQNENDIVSVLQGKRTVKEVKEDILKRNGLSQ